MRRDLPVWRTLLYVPVNVEKYVDKAHTRGADVIQLDLEDAVPHAEKAHARTLVQKNAARVRRGGADVVVRINRPLAHGRARHRASICPDVDALAITKTDSASHVRLLDELVSELEEKRGMTVGHTKFIAMIETPDAFFRIHEIVTASARIVACNIGGEDFALELQHAADRRSAALSQAAHDHRRRGRRHHAARLHRQRRRLRRLGELPQDGAPLARFRLHGRGLHPSRPGAPSSTRNTRRARRKSNTRAS